ncbi:DUF5675 family protein [Limibacter armeniacum]|uniref:DUF5675 family protein n=1 Tax=Limibacter armeniacum TaxID=466084 RepID=UPI002FE5A986
MKAILRRNEHSNLQTLGEFQLFDGEELVMECKTLELPWKDNQNSISCIPTGSYKAVFRDFGNYAGRAYHIQELDGSEVKGRSGILIHSGNFFTDTRGCILLGTGYADLEVKSKGIKKDGVLDLVNSRNTINKLIEIVGDKELTLDVIGEPESEITVTTIELDLETAPFQPNDRAVVNVKTILNFRSAPEKSAPKVLASGLANGTFVQILEMKGEWAKVFAPTVRGWVHGNFVKKDGKEAVVNTESGRLNVRTLPEVSSQAINALEKGTLLEVLKEQDEWLEVTALSVEGYVYGEYLSK